MTIHLGYQLFNKTSTDLTINPLLPASTEPSKAPSPTAQRPSTSQSTLPSPPPTPHQNPGKSSSKSSPSPHTPTSSPNTPSVPPQKAAKPSSYHSYIFLLAPHPISLAQISLDRGSLLANGTLPMVRWNGNDGVAGDEFADDAAAFWEGDAV